MSTTNLSEQEIQERLIEREALLEEVAFLTKKLVDLNRRVDDAEHAKTTFISLVHNVFNNPMMPLLNLSKRIEHETEPARVKKIATIIHDELLKVNFYLRNIFEVVSIESGVVDDTLSSIDVRTIVEESLEDLRYLLDEKSLTLRINDKYLHPLRTNIPKLSVIVLNLLSNALEYANQASEVSVSILPYGHERIRVVFENEGDPIHVKHHKELFNRFERVQDAHRASQGLGLGLSVARAHTETLGGNIDFSSEGNRTLFILELPTLTDEADITPYDDDLPFDNLEDTKTF